MIQLNTCFYFVSTEFGSLTTSQLMEKVKGLQNLAYQLGLDEGKIYCNWIQFFSSQNATTKKP